jgi:hypothetical protein
VDAVAYFESSMLSLMDEQEQAAVGDILARTSGLAAEGRLADAARAFAAFPFNDGEIALLEDAGTSRPQGATSRTCSTTSSK